MRRQILLAIGLAGAMLCNPHQEARANLPLAMGRSSIYLDSRPDFIYLDDYGFSVSWNSPYDVIYYGDAYFLLQNGRWYRAYDYRGPWGRIDDFDLPPAIRRHSWGDINRRRDIEYRRFDRNFWDNRFRQDRERWHDRDNRPGPVPAPRPVPEHNRPGGR